MFIEYKSMKHKKYKSPVTGKEYFANQEPRYAGLPTFMRTPIADSLEGLDIALAGVPYDGGVTNRAGARHGPREIRNQSTLMRNIHHVTRINPYEIANIADVGDVYFEKPFDHQSVHDDIVEFYSCLQKAGVIPLSAGGDHSITYPIFEGLVKGDPIGMIHIDAHTDTWGEVWGSKFHHGSPFRSAVESGLLDPKKTIQIGIRGAQNFTDGIDFSLSTGMRVIFIEEFSDLGVKEVVKEAIKIVGNSPVYLSFDVDGLDPVYAPGTGTPEVGGITTLEAQQFLRGLNGLNFIGGDVVEVAPPSDLTGNTALVGATMMYEILCLFANQFAK
jgi:guanidinopropionase